MPVMSPKLPAGPATLGGQRGLLPPNKPQIVATRCGLVTSPRQGTAGGRTDLRIENRQKHYIGCQDVSQLRVAIPAFYGKTDATGEHVLGNDYTWEGAIEITSPAMYQSLFAGGSQFPVIPSTGQAPPYIMTEPPLGLDMAKGSAFYMRQGVSVATDTLLIPASAQQAPAGDTGFISPAVASQVAATGAMTTPSGGTSFGGPQPLMIVGVPAAPMAAVAFLGDSIADGTGDTVDTHGNMGYIARGLDSVNGYPVPWMRQTITGDQLAQNTLDISPRKRSQWPYVTHLIIQLGTNDIAAASLATMQANMTGLLTAAKRTIGPYGKPLATAACCIMPKTTSSNSFVDAAGQTPVAGYTIGGLRDQYNTWLKAQVGGGLLDAVIDANPYVEDQAHLGKWITNGSANYPTTDGVHPASAIHILAAQAVNAWALGIRP